VTGMSIMNVDERGQTVDKPLRDVVLAALDRAVTNTAWIKQPGPGEMTPPSSCMYPSKLCAITAQIFTEAIVQGAVKAPGLGAGVDPHMFEVLEDESVVTGVKVLRTSRSAPMWLEQAFRQAVGAPSIAFRVGMRPSA
jgi:hypothetical protein